MTSTSVHKSCREENLEVPEENLAPSRPFGIRVTEARYLCLQCRKLGIVDQLQGRLTIAEPRLWPLHVTQTPPFGR